MFNAKGMRHVPGPRLEMRSSSISSWAKSPEDKGDAMPLKGAIIDNTRARISPMMQTCV